LGFAVSSSSLIIEEGEDILPLAYFLSSKLKDVFHPLAFFSELELKEVLCFYWLK